MWEKLGLPPDSLREEEQGVLDAVQKLLDAVSHCDTGAYSQLVAEDVSAFEFDVSPYRIDGIDFHLNLMKEKGKRLRPTQVSILTPRVQRFGNIAIASYTRLNTVWDEDGEPEFDNCNETRVFERREGTWVMVHFHRSEGA